MSRRPLEMLQSAPCKRALHTQKERFVLVPEVDLSRAKVVLVKIVFK